MHVNSQVATTQTTGTNSVVSNTTTSPTNVFSTLLSSGKEPNEISFEEYTKLTPEDIDQLFPKDTMAQENEKARSLHTRATGSDDEILNKVLFEDALNADDSRFHESTARGVDMIISFWEDWEKMKISLQKTEEYIKANNIKFPEPFSRQSMEIWSQIHSKIYEETVVPENEKKITAEELFHSFELSESYYPVVMEYNNYTTDSEYYQETRKAIDYHHKIKDEYYKQVDENKAVLNAYTNNTQQTAQKEKSKEDYNETDIEKNEDSIEVIRTRRELVEDIISMLRTGFTVEELERIEELLAEIKKKLKEEGGSDKESKIDKMLDELEKEIARLQKRITGVATIELNSGKKENFESTDPVIQGFESRIDNIQKNIEKLKAGKLAILESDNNENKKLSTKEEIDLINQLKQN